MNYQNCGWGWPDVYPYQGLRNYLEMMGMRIPETQQIDYYQKSGFPPTPNMPNHPVGDYVNSPMPFDSSSEMGMRICQGGYTSKEARIPEMQPSYVHPGFSFQPIQKMPFFNIKNSMMLGSTPEVGMGVYQGNMGYIQNGNMIPENQQAKAGHQTPLEKQQEPFVDNFKNSEKFDSTPDMGTAINHGNLGLMPQENRMYNHGNQGGESWSNKPFFSTPVMTGEHDKSLNCFPQMKTAACQKSQMESPVKDEQQTDSSKKHQFSSAQTPTKETQHSLFESPSPHQQNSSRKSVKARRTLEFPPTEKVGDPRNFPTTNPEGSEVSEKKNQDEEENEAADMARAEKDEMASKLLREISVRKQKIDKINTSFQSCEARLDIEFEEINSVYLNLKSIVEEAQQKALEPLIKRKQKLKNEMENLVHKLQREIDNLKNPLRKNTDSQHSLPLDQETPTCWESFSLDISQSLGTLTETNTNMMKEIQSKLETLSSLELTRIRTFAVDVKLDPSTAHHALDLSQDMKTVKDGGKKPEGPIAPESFDLFGSVLGLNNLTGKSYWEVEVKNKTGWDLGVVQHNVPRKGKLEINSNNGYWVVVHYEGDKYAALTVPPVSLSLKHKPRKVGVFVDYEEGLVSFYDVMAKSHIYSFTKCSFSGKIVPYFSPHLKENGKNANPLTISAIV